MRTQANAGLHLLAIIRHFYIARRLSLLERAEFNHNYFGNNQADEAVRFMISLLLYHLFSLYLFLISRIRLWVSY